MNGSVQLQPGTIGSTALQFLVLIVGIILIYTHKKWPSSDAVFAGGVFFVNIFWITMIITHDLKIWSFLRNTIVGNLFMFGLLVINLIYVAVLAVKGIFL